jgi:hypothetical protein
LLTLLSSAAAWGEQIPAAPTLTNPSPQAIATQATTGPGLVGIRTNFELLLTLGILLAGLLFALIVLYMSTRALAGATETISRLFTVVLMVTAVLVLITAGYSNDQIAPVFGLFGTIVGYVLGRRGDGAAGPPPDDPNAAAADKKAQILQNPAKTN